MKTKITVLFLFVLLSKTLILNAQNPFPDSLFGSNGFAAYPFPTVNGVECSSLLDLQNGYFIYGGYSYDINLNAYFIDMAKASYCGDLDTTFGNNGLVHYTFSQRNTAFDYNSQSDGKILSCGVQATSNAGSQQFPYVARFLSNGTPDTTFGTGGSAVAQFISGSNGLLFSVHPLADGRIVCTGYNGGSFAPAGIGAMRLMPDGSFDNTFNGNGKALYATNIGNTDGTGFVTPLGQVIALGSTDNVSPYHFIAVAWDSTGALDTSFGSGGVFIDSSTVIWKEVYATRLADGSIVMAGANSSGTVVYADKIDASGSLDPLFGVNGRITLTHPNVASIKAIHALANGKVLVMGSTNTGFGQGYIIQLDSNGSVDTTFGLQGFLICDLNGNSGTHYSKDIVETITGQWHIAGGGFVGLLAKRLTTVSNVPHISALWQGNTVLQTSGNGTYQWYFNASLISGATYDTLNATQNGLYTVELTDALGCSIVSDTFNLTDVGIQNNTPAESLNIFPNPFKETITVNMNDNNKFKLTLYDVSFRRVHYSEFVKTITLPSSFLGSGIYFYEIKNVRGDIFSGKVIKE